MAVDEINYGILIAETYRRTGTRRMVANCHESGRKGSQGSGSLPKGEGGELTLLLAGRGEEQKRFVHLHHSFISSFIIIRDWLYSYQRKVSAARLIHT